MLSYVGRSPLEARKTQRPFKTTKPEVTMAFRPDKDGGTANRTVEGALGMKD
ncbi:hypothetical protein SS37A_41190 (plasmid) [Methylocystis iwaonis]|uniref:Transposase n=1 Tax=Methylocystis iwaonis TaxID=2885079 RepID=A0ABN6VM14_9HYPH|nr:hypothetical protein SS37A_41190 [Methylocystis iwaonis]